MGQMSVFATARLSVPFLLAEFRIRIICVLLFDFRFHGQSGASIILNLCRYDFMFPWPVTIVLRFCVKFIFVCSLSATVEKYSFVVLPFFVVCHSFCQVILLFSSSSRFMALFGILL